MRAKRERASIGNPFASKRLERGRPKLCTRRAAERSMSAFGRGNRRRGMLAGAVGAVAASLAGGPAWAGSAAPGPEAGNILLASPKAPASFGAPALSPLVSVFNAGLAPQDDAPALGFLAEQKFAVPAVAAAASGGGAAPPKGRPAPPTGFAAATATASTEQPGAEENPPPPIYEPSAADPPLSPMQSAIEAATERLVARSDQPNPLGGDWRAARAAIAAFYAARGYEPVWIGKDGLTKAGRAALAQLERAKDDGLSVSSASLPRAIGPGLAADALADAEMAIASAVVTYAEQATGSRVPAARVWPFAFPAPNLADPGAALAETAAAPDPARRLADFNPPQKGYRNLREAWERLMEAAPRARAPVPDPGAGPQPGDGARRSKRPPGGRIHTASADAGLGFAAFARQRAAILANMEMWRWEPRDMGERRIEVDIPDFSVAVMDGDEVVRQARVIVGKPETPTPVFSSVMRYVILNPSWRVPDSIIKKELMSKLGALSRHGYEVKTVGGRLTVRQLPGDDNALGRVAFMFPNDHAVYLHDTPRRELFDEGARAFSHGCIRVEDPLSLAEVVLGGEASKWTEERIEEAVGGPEKTVFLPRPLPIHIEYFTESVDEFGELRERPDIYGLTRKVEGILAQASQD
jgi:murein L,D-transpeptidase YcbB/YkuD